MLTLLKDIRTKEGIKEFNIHSNGFDVYSNSSMLAPAVLSFQLFLLNMNRRLFLLFLCLNKCGILLGMKKIPGPGQG